MKPNLLLVLAAAILAMASAFYYFVLWRKARKVSPIRLRRKDSDVDLRHTRNWRWF